MVYPNIEEAVRAIAEDMQASIEVVSKLYTAVWAEFEVDARIRDYIPLFVSKRVRKQLKSNFAKAVGDDESRLLTDTAREGMAASFPEKKIVDVDKKNRQGSATSPGAIPFAV